MASDKMQAISNMNTRQKVIAILVVVVILIVLWQLSGLFMGSKPLAKTVPKQTAAMKQAGTPGAAPATPAPSQGIPKPADIPPLQPTTQREAEIMKLQQETQARYLQALNELQMLRVAKDIAVTSKDISSAKLAKVVAEKKIVDLLAPPPPPPTTNQPIIKPVVTSTYLDSDPKYTVVSVSQLQYRWGAVIGNKGVLYNVHVGDVLPPDGSRVVSITRDGVTLEKDGARRKVSLVPAI